MMRILKGVIRRKQGAKRLGVFNRKLKRMLIPSLNFYRLCELSFNCFLYTPFLTQSRVAICLEAQRKWDSE